ncbi:MAG TPA: cupin domain-containing protein [Candidatus Acidoferrales bacterium]|nr:cupin domain-containing protein [Candidatus Acidoferrales bacterium]
MELVNLQQKIDEAAKNNIRNTHLFEAENFRSWLLYFKTGDGTPMHFHQSPETFLVVEGKCSVKTPDGQERIIEKGDIVFLKAKDYYQITNPGPEPLVLFGNRSEPFGVPPTRMGEQKSGS